MKTQIAMPFCLVLAISYSTDSFAGQAEITWSDPARYTDIWPSQQVTRATTLKNVKRVLTAAFAESAAALPDGYIFEADITDVDLAGRVSPPALLMVDPGLINRPELIATRTLTENYMPELKFGFTLTDSDGKVVLAEQEVIVNDPMYLTRVKAGSTSTPFFYEARMIQDWFSVAIASAIKQ